MGISPSGWIEALTREEYMRRREADEEQERQKERERNGKNTAKPDDKWSEAINPKSGATGWFQHMPKWWEERSFKAGFSGWLAVEPRANVGVAAWLYYKQPHPKWGNASHWYPSRSCWEK